MYKCQKSTVYSLPPRKSRLTEIFFYGINFPTCFQLSYFSEHEEKEVFKELAVIFLLLIVVVEIMRVSQSKIVFFFLHLPTLIIVFFFIVSSTIIWYLFPIVGQSLYSSIFSSIWIHGVIVLQLVHRFYMRQERTKSQNHSL